jgi:hypothetical protein
VSHSIAYLRSLEPDVEFKVLLARNASPLITAACRAAGWTAGTVILGERGSFEVAGLEGCVNSEVDVMCAARGFEGTCSDLPAAAPARTAMPGSSSAAKGESSATRVTVFTNRRQLYRLEPKRLRTLISALFCSTACSVG